MCINIVTCNGQGTSCAGNSANFPSFICFLIVYPSLKTHLKLTFCFSWVCVFCFRSLLNISILFFCLEHKTCKLVFSLKVSNRGSVSAPIDWSWLTLTTATHWPLIFPGRGGNGNISRCAKTNNRMCVHTELFTVTQDLVFFYYLLSVMRAYGLHKVVSTALNLTLSSNVTVW